MSEPRVDLEALRDDLGAAQLNGYDVWRQKTVTYVTASALLDIAASLRTLTGRTE